MGLYPDKQVVSMASNPNPSRITAGSWWLMEQLLKLEKGTANGGIFANKPGYHNTRSGNSSRDYSVVDAVDKRGPSDKAAAYDWTFRDAQAGRYDTIMKYTNRLLRSAKDQQDPRLNGWREFYGQADRDTYVEGWDTRYGRAATSDPSHLWHLHLSESREHVGEKAPYPNKIAMLSVLKGETVAEWRGNDMELSDRVKVAEWIDDKWDDVGKDISVSTALASGYGHSRAAKDNTVELLKLVKANEKTLAAILAAVKGADQAAILAAIKNSSEADARRDAELKAIVEGYGNGTIQADKVAELVVKAMGDKLGS